MAHRFDYSDSDVGVYTAFVIDALSFFISAYLIFQLRYTPSVVPVNSGKSFGAVLREYVEGLRYLGDQRDILAIVLQKAAVTFCFAAAYDVTAVAISQNVFVIGEGGGIGLGFIYASVGVGSNNHYDTEAFAQWAGIKLVHIPNKGGGAAITNDLVSGDAQVALVNAASSAGVIKGGLLKVLAVMADERVPHRQHDERDGIDECAVEVEQERGSHATNSNGLTNLRRAA